MDTPQVFIKRNQATLNWVPATNDVGSVLIYRATDNLNDNVGSRVIIGSVGGTINTYTDTTSGSRFNIYRVQFWNGTGSSPLSDPVTPQMSDILSQIEEVKLTAKIGPNSDLGSDEIYEAIKDATNWIFREYGDPIKKTAIYIDNTDTDESYTYNFTGDKGPVYQIRSVTISDVEEEMVSGSSWKADYKDGLICFDSVLTGSYQNEVVRIEWVPQIFNDLVKIKTALDLTEAGMIIDGTDVINARVTKFTRQIEELRNAIKPKGIWAPRHITDNTVIDESPTNVSSWADIIGQKYDRRTLRFDND